MNKSKLKRITKDSNDNSVQKQPEQYSSATDDQWIEVFDKKGRSYWENKITGETSYETPAMDHISAQSPSNPGNAQTHNEEKQNGDPDNKIPFYGNHNKPKNAIGKSKSSPGDGTTWHPSPLQRKPLSNSQKYYFICHVVTDILCIVAAYLCLSMPDKFRTINSDTDADTDDDTDCQERVDTVSGVGQAVLILTIMSMCMCSVPYLCVVIYGKITDKSLQSAIGCFFFIVAAIGILWATGIVILVYVIGQGLTLAECKSIEDINGDLVVCIILLIPSMFRIVIFCGYVLSKIDR